LEGRVFLLGSRKNAARSFERELKRKARLVYIEDAEGFFDDDLDALAFVNRLRASDERIK